MSKRLRLEVEDIDEITIVNFIDERILEEQLIQVIGEQLFALVNELGRKKVLLNFKNVTYLSSACFGKFVALNAQLKRAGGALALCSLLPTIQQDFEITRMDRLLKIQKDQDMGLQYLQS